MGGAVCGGPSGRQELAEFTRTGHGQALDEILKIGLRFDAMIPRADEQGNRGLSERLWLRAKDRNKIRTNSAESIIRTAIRMAS